MIPATSTYITALTAFKHGKLVFKVTIAGYSRVFSNYDDGIATPWLVLLDDLSITVDDLNGGASVAQAAFTVQDAGAAITADFPSFVFEGKKVTITQGFVGMADGDFITLFTGFIDTVGSYNSGGGGNLEYYFVASDVSVKLAQVVYNTGDNGAQTSGENFKTLNGSPFDLMLDILNNQIRNADGSIGLDPTLIDTTKIEALRDGPFAGVQFLFHLDQAPAADDFIKNQLLKPIGCYLWVNSQGQVSINSFYPLQGPVAQITLGPDIWLAIPEAEQSDMVNTVQFQFDKDDGGSASGSNNYFSQDTEEYAPSVALYGLFGEQVIQADGMRSALQGFFIAKMVARLIFMRYGLKNLKFDSGAPEATWQAVRIEPGDIVAVTDPHVPDRQGGVMGVTGRLFEVLNRTVNFTEGKITLTMLDASYLSKFGLYKIAPDAEADYAAASGADKLRYMFMCGSDDKYSNTDAGHGLG